MKTNTNQSLHLPQTGEQVLDSWLDQLKAPVYPTTPLQVSIQFKESSLHFLRAHVERDITNKSRGWNPAGFTLLELLDIERLLTRHTDGELLAGGDNILLTYPQLGLLTSFVIRYHAQAIDHEDSLRHHALSDALDALTLGFTFLNPLCLTDDQISYRPYPFRLLRHWCHRFFAGFHHAQPLRPVFQEA